MPEGVDNCVKGVYINSMLTRDNILIGGQALRRLGHDRHTDDIDYLVWAEDTPVFTHRADGDLINAAANNFLGEVFAAARPVDGVADAQTLLELKAWAWMNYLQNGCWKKADQAEYDIKFLVRDCGVSATAIINKYAHGGELAELEKLISACKKEGD